MIHAAIFRNEYDDPFINDAVKSAWRWASDVWVFTDHETPFMYPEDCTHVLVEAKRDKDFLEQAWSWLGKTISKGDWVVLLMGDEIVFSHDALVKASRHTDLDVLLFNLVKMWDGDSYIKEQFERPVLRALRHHHQPLVFPESDLKYSDLSPMTIVNPYIPVGDILQLRWMDEGNREASEMKHKPLIGNWTKGDIRVVR